MRTHHPPPSRTVIGALAALAAGLVPLVATATAATAAPDGDDLVIAEIYAVGGLSRIGSSGEDSAYLENYVEIHNPTAGDIDLADYQLATYNFGGPPRQVVALDGVLPAGGTLLVLASAGDDGVGESLTDLTDVHHPDLVLGQTDDVIGLFTAGEPVSITASQLEHAILATGDLDGRLVDLVSYGRVWIYEGLPIVLTVGNDTSMSRTSMIDTDHNRNDFHYAAPDPTASTTVDPPPPPPPPPTPEPRPGITFYLTDDWGTVADHVFTYGRPGDQVLVGDWDGDGADTLAVRRGNRFYFSATTGGPATVELDYGRAGDTVLVGDWDGDGSDSLGVRRGNQYLLVDDLSSTVAHHVLTYGRAGDQVLVGDWDGDVADTLTVRRGRDYYISNSLTATVAERVVRYGRPDDQTLVGDWDGDGMDTLTVRRGNQYLVSNSLSSTVADLVVHYGRAGDQVLVGDWDGDGSDTLGVRR